MENTKVTKVATVEGGHAVWLVQVGEQATLLLHPATPDQKPRKYSTTDPKALAREASFWDVEFRARGSVATKVRETI